MLPLRHILLLSSGYLHYISITSSFISWYNNVISGSRKTKQHISLELPQQTDVMWRHKTLIWSLAPVWGQSRADWDWPLSVRLWGEYLQWRRVAGERDSPARDAVSHRWCWWPLLTTPGGRSPGSRILQLSLHPPLLAAHTGHFLTGCMCHVS